MVYQTTKELVDNAMARKKADIVLKNCKVLNIFTREIIEADIVITRGRTVHVGKLSDEFIGKGTLILDIAGAYASPGFIESHIHVESSMLTLSEFTKAVALRGTTTVVIDPHELANVCGLAGLEHFIQESQKQPITFLIEAPSCVPAIQGLETSAATLDSSAISKLLSKREVVALAEVMNYPGVYLAHPEVIEKIDVAKRLNKIIEGHAPLLSNKELQAYIAAGISSDHENASFEEALEKLRLGMKVQVRDGTFAKDLESIMKPLRKKKLDTRNILIASDDRSAIDLIEYGHLDYSLQKLVKIGYKPIEAIQMVTLNPARHLRMDHELGGIAPGRISNIVILEDLKKFKVKHVIAKGKLIVENGKFIHQLKKSPYPAMFMNTMVNLEIPTKNDLMIEVKDKNKVKVHVMGLKEHSLITKKEEATLLVTNGFVQPNVLKDILPVVVINRHTKEKKIGKGFIRGLGIKNGAIASTVAHDSHQLVCVGTDYDFMLRAIKALKNHNGGQVVVAKNIDSVSETVLPLSYAGIMSTKSLEEVTSDMKKLQEATKILTPTISEPFMSLSFIALPVIPYLKITDYGVIDVNNFKVIPLIKED